MIIDRSEEELLDIVFKEIMDHCLSLKTYEKQLKYLEDIFDECREMEDLNFFYENDLIDLTEYQRRGKEATTRLLKVSKISLQKTVNGMRVVIFEGNESEYETIVKNIDGLLDKLKFEYQTIKREKDNYNYEQKNVLAGKKIIIKSQFVDIVRIFEAAKIAGIIWMKTEVKEFANLFFSNQTSSLLFEKKYNATVHRITKDESRSNSKELVEFVKCLCSKSFRGDHRALNEIIEYLEKLQKNII